MENKIIKKLVCVCLLMLALVGVVLDIIYVKVLPKAINYLIVILSSLLILASLLMLYSLKNTNGKRLSIKQMSMIGIQSAITVILYYFVKINLPFFPPWLDIQVSEIPALITGFAYGPYAGCLVILVRFILKIPGTMTAGVGEAADLLIGLSLVLISSLTYKKHRNLKGALIGTFIGIIISTILACILNAYVLIPAFIYIAGYPYDALVKGLSYLPFEVSKENFMLSYILVGVLPFNLFRYLFVFGLTFLLYKKIHILLDRITASNKNTYFSLSRKEKSNNTFNTNGSEDSKKIFIRCPYCGAKNDETNTKCSNCGGNL